MSRKKYTITEIQKIAQSHDGKLLSTKYINTVCRKDEGKSFCPDCTNIFGKRFSGTKIFKQLGKTGLLQQLKEKEQSVKGSGKS